MAEPTRKTTTVSSIFVYPVKSCRGISVSQAPLSSTDKSGAIVFLTTRESEIRSVDAKYAPGYKVMFSEEYPFLLISNGSLKALNSLLKEPVSINRFRPKPEVTETLKKCRSDLVLRPSKAPKGVKVYFGQMIICTNSQTQGQVNMIIVGDPVYVINMFSSAEDAAA